MDQLVFTVEECWRKRNRFSCIDLVSNEQETAGELTFTPQPNH